MTAVEVPIENTVSRRGSHVAVSVAVVVRPDGSARPVSAPRGAPRVRGTYSRGAARLVRVELSPGEYLVHARLVRGPQGRVKGRIVVYSSEGRPVLEAVYRRLKVRRSRGDPSLGWVVEAAMRAIGLDRYVRRYNWKTGEPT